MGNARKAAPTPRHNPRRLPHAPTPPTIAQHMPSRPPILLWRHLGFELIRILALATAALVVVISFAATIKPLADGEIGLLDAGKLMGLMIVPMLQFALPFAAGLAATLSYHRFAADNEATAAGAGGVSHRALLVPALVMGLALAITVGVLTNAAIPHFLRAAERLITRDIGRLIVAPIKRGQTIEMGRRDNRWDLAADEVHRLSTEAVDTAIDHVAMFRVLAAGSDPDSGNRFYLAADRVDIWFFDDPENEATQVQLVFQNPTGVVPGEQGRQTTRIQAKELHTTRLVIPQTFRDDPKFLTLKELRAVDQDPRRMDAIDLAARRLARNIDEIRLMQRVSERLREDAAVVLTREADDGPQTVHLRARALRPADANGWVIEPLAGESTIQVEFASADAMTRRHEARSATLTLAADANQPDPALSSVVGVAAANTRAPSPPALTLRLTNVTTEDRRVPGAAPELPEISYTNLRLPEPAAPARITDLPIAQLTADARSLADAAPFAADTLLRDVKRLNGDVRELRSEITSKLHERAAFVFATCLMVLTGAVMALRLRDALPLPVYLWSFLPAMLTIITISSGQGITHKAGIIGLPVLWSGVVALSIFTFTQYKALARH